MATKRAYTRKTRQTPEMKSIRSSAKATYKCTCCGKEYQKQAGNFVLSLSPLYESNNGYIPLCRDCADSYYSQLLKYYNGNEEIAIEHCCRTFDWYYDPAMVAGAVKNMRLQTSNLLKYSSMLGLYKSRGTTYLDTIKHQNWQTGVPKKKQPESGIDEVKKDVQGEVPQEAVHMFGLGYSPDEYQYLMDEYQNWTTRHECKTKAQEELFKNLCRAQVAVQRAQRGGNIKEMADATKMLQDLMQSAGLKPTQNNENSLLEQNTFGTLIKKLEKDRPVAEAEEEWKDVDGINRYIDTWFLGHLSNLVHLDNDHSEAYRREIAKYTVKPPVYEDDEELGDTSLLDKYSTKDKDKEK